MLPHRIEVVTNPAAVAGGLAELHAICFDQSPQKPWSAGAIATLLATPGTFGLVALGGGDELIGFILGRAIADEGEVLTVCVSPAVRRCGIATALLDQLRGLLAPRRRILLEVALTNRAARDLYAGLGFQEVGRRPEYYKRDGRSVDALLLARDGG